MKRRRSLSHKKSKIEKKDIKKKRNERENSLDKNNQEGQFIYFL